MLGESSSFSMSKYSSRELILFEKKGINIWPGRYYRCGAGSQSVTMPHARDALWWPRDQDRH
jgi:hypothetical protein